MLDLVELIFRFTPGRLWKRAQIVKRTSSELNRLDPIID
jgi:hypothetical protein